MMESSDGPSLIYDELYEEEEPRFNKSLCNAKTSKEECQQDNSHKANCHWSANRHECLKRTWGEMCKRAHTAEECTRNERDAEHCYWNATRDRCLKIRATPVPSYFFPRPCLCRVV